MRVIIINGPNLNLLGKREPEIYGNETFESFLERLKVEFSHFQIEYFQSNIEGELINKVQETGFTFDFILLNAGGYTHSSVALADAIAAVSTPVIEVHLTNIFSREEFRRNSLISQFCKGIISGFGLDSYRLALEFINSKVTANKKED